MYQSDNKAESFGAFLQRERELREITLEEIAAYTRIKLRALEAIEHDDFVRLPPLAFVRAFIRCYADYIGLNVPDVMLRFDGFVQSRYPELTGEIALLPKKHKPQQRYVPLMLGIGVVLLMIFAYWLSRSPQSPPATESKPPPAEASAASPTEELPPTSEVVAAGPASPAPAPASPASRPGQDAAAPSSKAPAEIARESQGPVVQYDAPLGPPLELAQFLEEEQPEPIPPRRPPVIRHRLTITVAEACWLKFFIDDDEPRQVILQPEQTVTFEAVSSVRVKIGNPDGVGLVVYNDRRFDYKPLCSPWWLNFPAGPDDNPCP